VERKIDGKLRAVKVTTQEPLSHVPILEVECSQPACELFPFHPQQLQLDHYPIAYEPEQLPFHPMIPEGITDNWTKMMQWAQPGFCSGYIAQSYQKEGNYWAGICLSNVAKMST